MTHKSIFFNRNIRTLFTFLHEWSEFVTKQKWGFRGMEVKVSKSTAQDYKALLETICEQKNRLENIKLGNGRNTMVSSCVERTSEGTMVLSIKQEPNGKRILIPV